MLHGRLSILQDKRHIIDHPCLTPSPSRAETQHLLPACSNLCVTHLHMQRVWLLTTHKALEQNE